MLFSDSILYCSLHCLDSFFLCMCSVYFAQPSHPAASMLFSWAISLCTLQRLQTASADILLHSVFFFLRVLFLLGFRGFFTTYKLIFSFFLLIYWRTTSTFGFNTVGQTRMLIILDTYLTLLITQFCKRYIHGFNFPCLGA